MDSQKKYQATVVGSGPNGLAAAITLAGQGLSVLLIEAEDRLGGGARSAELTLPGYIHDVCSSVFALAEDSPVFKNMNLQDFGLQYVRPEIAIAHPLENGRAAFVNISMEETAENLGRDAASYKKIFRPMVQHWEAIRSAFLGPLHWSALTSAKIKFGREALRSGENFARHHFQTVEARALFAGMAAHSMLPLEKLTTASIGIVLNTMAHVNGWPLAAGGAQKITDALEQRFLKLGGVIQRGTPVRSLSDIPPSDAILLDLTPRQLLQIAGNRLSSFYKWQLGQFDYGPGVFKIDWALSEPAPFLNSHCRKAGTVHLGGTLQEVMKSESEVGANRHPEKPFVLFVQPTIADPDRAPAGEHIAWAYCHVPNGSTRDMTEIIESQVERFAPGFKDCILARNTMNAADMQVYNANYVGGDINGGAVTVDQLFTRPVIRLSPYRTSARGIYICSSSTPPGGGVHGICGYYAARRALKDLFGISLPWL